MIPEAWGSWQRLLRRNGTGTGLRGREESESRHGCGDILSHGEPEALPMLGRSDSG